MLFTPFLKFSDPAGSPCMVQLDLTDFLFFAIKKNLFVSITFSSRDNWIKSGCNISPKSATNIIKQFCNTLKSFFSALIFYPAESLIFCSWIFLTLHFYKTLDQIESFVSLCAEPATKNPPGRIRTLKYIFFEVYFSYMEFVTK